VLKMDEVLSLVEEHEEWRTGQCINLIPSENITSKEVRKILGSDLGHRYTLPLKQKIHGTLVENAYRGTKFFDKIERLGEELACEIFNANFASLKPLSGHMAGMIMLLSTCKRGESLLTIDARHGGYDGYLPENLPTILGLQAGFLPFEERSWDLDYDKCIKKIVETRPRLVILGASFLLFPYNLKLIRKACEEADALLGYDASHVLGLIAGKAFQRPFEEGVDILIGSTHKSFFGPQGGLILCQDKEIFEEVRKNLIWRTLDNAHWNRIGALAQALLEARDFGEDYANQVIANSKALAEELDSMGLPIKFKNKGFTECHQILIDKSKLKKNWGTNFNDLAVSLEKSNIIIDAVGRLGTNEVTRMGAKEKDMRILADLIVKVLKGSKVKKEVLAFGKSLEMDFCY